MLLRYRVYVYARGSRRCHAAIINPLRKYLKPRAHGMTTYETARTYVMQLVQKSVTVRSREVGKTMLRLDNKRFFMYGKCCLVK